MYVLDMRLPARSGRGLLPLLLAVALVAGLFATGAVPRIATAITPARVAVPADPRMAALARAKATGRPTTVDTLTTAMATTTANPDGTFTYAGAATPKRVNRGGHWTPVDATLAPTGDGGFAPRSAVGSLRFSGGGTGPFAVIGAEAWSIAYSFPTALPAPRIDGATATYAGALPGVDLVLTATVDGSFEDTLVVRDRAAAANPALRKLRFGIAAHGVSVRSDAAGDLTATDGHGSVVLTSGTPRMWDSSVSSVPAGPSANRRGTVPVRPSTVHGPGDGTKTAAVGRRMSVVQGAGTETLLPDPALLDAPGLVFPLYLDPWQITGGTGNHTYTQLTSGDPNNAARYWTTLANGDGEGAGKADGYSGTGGDYCGNQACGIDRTVINYDMPVFNAGEGPNVQVNYAYVQSNAHFVSNSVGLKLLVHEWSMHAATSSSDWNNPPAYDNSVNANGSGNPIGGVYFTPKAGTYFPNAPFQVPITGSAQLAVHAGLRQWPLMLTGEETSMDAFIRIDVTATNIVINYAYVPQVPTSLHTTPSAADGTGNTCGTGADNGYLGASSGNAVTLYATPATQTPAARVAAYFTVHDDTQNTYPLWIASTAGLGPSGQQQAIALTLTNGHHYTWYAATGDDNGVNTGYTTMWSANSASCAFTYDSGPPTQLGTLSSDFPAPGGGKAAGASDQLTLSATDSGSGVSAFKYHFDSGATTSVSPSGSSGATASVTISYLPTQWGTHTLTYDAVDRAGNTAESTYLFYVADSPNRANVPGNLTGLSNAGTATPQWAAADANGNLRAYSPADLPNSTGVLVAAANQAPADGTWARTLVTHRGSAHGQYADDLFAWSPSQPGSLYTYFNSPIGTFSASHQNTDLRPDCSAGGSGHATSAFPCYQAGGAAKSGSNNYAPDWRGVRAITALGAFPFGSGLSYYPSGSTGVGSTTLLTAENDGAGKANLWFYPTPATGGSTAALGLPYLLSQGGPSPVPSGASASWTGYDVLCPGDVTGDGIPDLWLRDRATGTVYQATLTLVANPDPRGGQMPRLGSLAAIAGAPQLPVATYPQIATDGSLDGSGPALVAFTTSGTPVVFGGAALGSATTATGGFTGEGQAESGLSPARPVAGLTVTQSPQGSLTVTADASASRAAAAAITSYAFDFGDGTAGAKITATAPATSVSYTYATPRTYQVRVTVTDAAGLTSTLVQQIAVNAASPIAALSVPATVSIGVPFTADASASTPGFGSITSYHFDFGDGTVVTSATAKVSHTYTDPSLAFGSVTITVTVTDGNNLTSQAAQSPSVLPGPTAPTAAVSITPATGISTATPITADASASIAGDNPIASYSFDFGDGTVVTGSAPTATHAYAATGTYTVTVTVTDSAGIAATASRTVSVTVIAPSAALALSAGTTAVGTTVTADASASTPGTNPIASYAFDFGDGTTAAASTAPTAGHAYNAAGTYTVKVTIADNTGLTSIATRTVTVKAPPTARLTLTPATGQAPLTVTAGGSGSTAGGSAITGYSFGFGDGAAEVGPQAAAGASHVYVTPGTYTVLLTVTDAAGFTATASAAVTVTNPCPCSVFAPTATPAVLDPGDSGSVELGMRIQPAIPGDVTGVRFYKAAANTGTHTGTLWTADGTLLATGTFTDETATGWQTLAFTTPVPVKAGTVYVVSYHAPNGHYSYTGGYFSSASAGSGPITAPQDGAAGPNGVFGYGSATLFPGTGNSGANYWVDAVFDTVGVPTSPPTVGAADPAPGATGVDTTATVTASFSTPLDVANTTFTLTDDASGTQVPASVAYNPIASAAVLTPSTQLPTSTTFTASVKATDGWGHTMATPYTWTFTTGPTPASAACPCSIFGPSAVPGTADYNDAQAVTVGVTFTSNTAGKITAVRFYKSAANTGTHVGSLWTADGTLLATGTFTGESATGWQTLTFATPVSIAAGTTYVASYFAPGGHYAADLGYFAYQRIASPLTALANTVARGNGVYVYASANAFPTQTGNGANYWVDVVFTP